MKYRTHTSNCLAIVYNNNIITQPTLNPVQVTIGNYTLQVLGSQFLKCYSAAHGTAEEHESGEEGLGGTLNRFPMAAVMNLIPIVIPLIKLSVATEQVNQDDGEGGFEQQ